MLHLYYTHNIYLTYNTTLRYNLYCVKLCSITIYLFSIHIIVLVKLYGKKIKLFKEETHNMKKLFSYLLALTLLVSTMSVAFAAPADVTVKEQVKAVDVLMALDVINGYPDGTYKPENVVKRAEMAKLVVTALGLKAVAQSNATKFEDVKGHWAQGYVQVCVDLGIAKGYPDGTFKPEKAVTYSEALTMLVRALGWTDEALGGVWPTNYLNKAMTLKLLKNVQFQNAGAPRGDIAVMLYNTLTKPIGTINQDGKYVETLGDNMLARLAGKKGDKKVILGTEDSMVNLRDSVGKWSSVYENESDKVILVMDAGTTLVGSFNSNTPADIKTFKVGDDKYSVNPGIKGLDKDGNPTDIAYFKNGELDSVVTDVGTLVSLVGKDNYMLSTKASGKTIKAVYAASQWEITKHKIVKKSDLDKIASKKTLLTKKFAKDDNGNIDCMSFEHMGFDKLTDIKEGDVVYVYEAASGVIRKVAVGTEKLENVEVTKVSSDQKEFTMGGKTYKVADQVSSADQSATVKPKDKVDVKLDAYGKIYEIKTVSGSSQYAVLLDTGDGSGSGLNAVKPKVKLFLSDGTNKIFDVDHTKPEVSSAYINASGVWASGAEAGDLVEYKTDSKGVVVALKELVDEAGNHSGNVSSTGAYEWNSTTIFIKENTVAFKYSGTDKAKASNYSVMEASKLFKTDNLDSLAYADPSTLKVKALLSFSATSANKTYALVKGYSTIIDGYDVELIMTDGSTVNKVSTVDPSTYVNDGKVYELAMGTDDKINGFNVVTSTSNTSAGTVAFDGNNALQIKDGGGNVVETIAVEADALYVDFDTDYTVKDSSDLDEASVNANDLTLVDTNGDGANDVVMW